MVDHRSGLSPRLGLFQIFYDETSRARLDGGFLPLFNPRACVFLENTVIADILGRLELPEFDWVGFFSPSFSLKIPLRSAEVCALLEDDGYAADFYSFFGGTRGFPSVWAQGESHHRGLTRAAEWVLRRAGFELDLSRLATPLVFQNHFVARTAFYTSYVKEMLVPCMEVMAHESSRDLLFQDSGYYRTKGREEDLQELFGVPFYPFHPFICERLVATWLSLHPEIRLKQIWNGRTEYQVTRLGASLGKTARDLGRGALSSAACTPDTRPEA